MPSYVKQTWLNGMAGSTPINAERLTYIEDGIEAVSDTAELALSTAEAAGDSPFINIMDFNDGLFDTPANRRATIQAAIDSAPSGGTFNFPNDAQVDVSGGTITLPPGYSNVHTTFRFIGNNTRFYTTTAHPIISESYPVDNPAAVTRANRRFIFEGFHFQGTSLIGQIGLRIIGSYLSEIRHCSFQQLEDGLDLIFCLASTVTSIGTHSNLNHGIRHRYGMMIDNGLGLRFPLWSGAAETNSNGNCPTVAKCRDYATVPAAAHTITNKQVGASARVVTDAVLNSTTTLVSDAADFREADLGATVAHASYPSGSTTISRIVDERTVITLDASSSTASAQSVTITRNIATLTTSVAHGYVVGRWVLVKGLGSTYDGMWKITDTTSTTFSYNRTGTEASTAVAGTPRTVTDATIAVANPTLTSATAAFLLSDIGATVAHANYPSGSTTITAIISPTQVNTANAASGAASGQTVTITRRTTSQVGQKSQLSFEGISEIIVDGQICEGGQGLTGIYYDQGGSTTAKGMTIRDAHPEHAPLLASIMLVGTGGGHIIVEGGSWTQGNCMVDATGFTTGVIHFHNQSVLFGKWRGGAVWCFQMSGAIGNDPTLTSWWDGTPALYMAPILRNANGTTEAGFGNNGVVAFKGSALFSGTGLFTFLSSDVSPKITMATSKGLSIGMWNAAANPATLANNTLFFWNDTTNARLALVVKDNAGTTFTIPISHAIPGILAGTGTPEGSKTAPVGTIYMRIDGGAATSFYVKESGAGNTGWVAK